MPGSPNQRDFAALVGIARSTVIRYEADEPGTDKPIVLIRWAEVTGYDLAWLQHGDGPPAPPSHNQPVTLRQEDFSTLPLAA